MTVLTVREELGVDRRSELIEGGVSFPEGEVESPARCGSSGPPASRSPSSRG